MLKLLACLVLALSLVASKRGGSRHVASNRGGRRPVPSKGGGSRHDHGGHDHVQYAQLGQKGYVAAYVGNSVLFNGKDRNRLRTLEECKDACTETDGCFSFYHCSFRHHWHFNTCWLKDLVLTGNEQTRRDSGCTTYYVRGHTGSPTSAPSPASTTKTCENGVEYAYANNFTETERCDDGKRFIYTDRYENETRCVPSATSETDYCWWDTTIESNCLESSECVWLTDKIDQGLCYCSISTDCEACSEQTPAPTVNKATSQCPKNCEKYYLGCVGMYCNCLGGCTSPEEAGCSEPVNAGCYVYYTNRPTPNPSSASSNLPEESLIVSPTFSPSTILTKSPTESPSASPTESPTTLPTLSPTTSPTSSPTKQPKGIGARDDVSYCTPSRKCSVGQGDCDNNNDCASGLICGRNNCQKFNAKALSWTDCCIRKFGLTSRSKTGWVNQWDGVLNWSAGTNRMITGFVSEHHNHRKDRRWAIYTAAASGVTCTPQGLSGYANDWDDPLTFVCPANQALYGVYSVHNNQREDRRWKFSCCVVSSNAYLERGRWSNYRNKWNKRLKFRCSSTQVLVGLKSYHNNHRGDRRWKFYCSDLINF